LPVTLILKKATSVQPIRGPGRDRSRCGSWAGSASRLPRIHPNPTPAQNEASASSVAFSIDHIQFLIHKGPFHRLFDKVRTNAAASRPCGCESRGRHLCCSCHSVVDLDPGTRESDFGRSLTTLTRDGAPLRCAWLPSQNLQPFAAQRP
jgi:hypothetical protein